MAVTVDGRQPLLASERAYAEEKLQRLLRHASLHDITMVIDHEPQRVPACLVEVMVHMHRAHLAVKAEAMSVNEAIDLVIDKADRAVLRRKDRITDHKGQLGAGHLLAEHGESDGQHGTTNGTRERRVHLKPMSFDDAVAEASRKNESHFLYLREERGDVGLLVLRRGGGYDLVVGELH